MSIDILLLIGMIGFWFGVGFFLLLVYSIIPVFVDYYEKKYYGEWDEEE